MEAESGKNGTGRPNGRDGLGGHSADVRIHLRVGDELFAVSQIGGGWLTFAQPAIIRGNRGEVLLSIDGNERMWPVDLSAATTHSGPSPVVEVAFKHAGGVNGHGYSHQIDELRGGA